MNVQLTDEGMKAALKDRFRVINLDTAGKSLADKLNEFGSDGFAILYLTKKFIIMTRIVNLGMPNSMAMPEGWSVPGAVGTDGNA